MMPRHTMTLSRHQNKLLQTPATLETLGSTSMCQLMDTRSWSSLWQGVCFRAKLPESCLQNNSRAAATHSARILSRPTQVNQELPATNSKKDRFWLNLKLKFDPKNEVIFSPNETTEVVSQKLKLKKWLLSQIVQNEKKYRGAKKKLLGNVPDNPFCRCSRNRGVCLLVA